jgi:hypothetical protein
MSYLILHKVRGEPAFDIADQIEGSGTDSDPGPWWIIPTSGHRAYPYQYWPMQMMWHHTTNGVYVPTLVDPPADWPDHYEIDKGSKPTSTFNIMTIISPMMTKIKRRL